MAVLRIFYWTLLAIVSGGSTASYAVDLTLQVGDQVHQVAISATSQAQVDFPTVPSDSNLVFTLDTSDWNMQDTEEAAVAFTIKRHDLVDTATDEYRHALMVVRPLTIENEQISLRSDTEIWGWGWASTSVLAWMPGAEPISDPEEVVQFISISGQTIEVDFQNLRTVLGRTGTSNPNDFEWDFRLLWSSHLDQGALQPLSQSDVDNTWLPLSTKASFTDPLSQGYGVSGHFTVGLVEPDDIDIELYAGWNLIMPPYEVTLAETEVPQSQIESIWQINVETATFSQLAPDGATLSSGVPYWLRLSIEEPLAITDLAISTGYRTIEGTEWSLLSVTESTSVASLFSEIGTEGFWHWDGGQWQSSLSDVPAFLNGFSVFEPGQAYYYQ